MLGSAIRSKEGFVAHSEDDLTSMPLSAAVIAVPVAVAEIDAAGQHRGNCLSRFYENKLRLQTLFAEITAVAAIIKGISRMLRET